MKPRIKQFLPFLFILCTLTACGQAESTAIDEPWSPEARVSYLGPAGTYTEEATRQFFHGEGTFLPQNTVADAIREVSAGTSDYAVIPQENTLGGAVTDYVDALMAEDGIYVVGEVILPISQTLLGVPGATLEDITRVCSHAQGIKQTERWRTEHLPDAVTEEMPSTAAAASYVAEQKDVTIAAIAAPGAAELYGLSVLAENVQITDTNRTRFYVLAASPLQEERYERAVFLADCTADQIDDIIVTIHNTGLEMVTIHDRPAGDALGSYHYIIETTHAGGVKQRQIDKICSHSAVRFLGSFDAVEIAAE